MNRNKMVRILSNRPPFILGSDQFASYAVLLPLIEKKDGLHILFEVRSLSLRRQPGEICFPGGKMDPEDMSPKETALRETFEELGLQPHLFSDVSPLDFLVTPFGTIIYPYIGFLSSDSSYQLNQQEVQEVFTVPLSYFQANKPQLHYIQVKLEPEPDFPYESIVGGENYQWQARKIEEHFYHYQGRTIWGLTARMIKHLIDVVGN